MSTEEGAAPAGPPESASARAVAAIIDVLSEAWGRKLLGGDFNGFIRAAAGVEAAWRALPDDPNPEPHDGGDDDAHEPEEDDG